MPDLLSRSSQDLTSAGRTAGVLHMSTNDTGRGFASCMHRSTCKCTHTSCHAAGTLGHVTAR
eukprot:40857-Rhodomonas_salina.1